MLTAMILLHVNAYHGPRITVYCNLYINKKCQGSDLGQIIYLID